MAVVTACGAGGNGDDDALRNTAFTRLGGGEASFADYRGTPVVVNFWASTCVPCVTEMPAFEQVKQSLGDKVAFVGINVQETDAAASSFVEQVKVTWDIGRDPDASIITAAKGAGLPTTLILDREGRIVFRHLGALDAGQLRDELTSRGFA